ncbi:hypothetical protein [Streptomyces sp. NWU339]|uniref:hypothetical protein n=1 Tax=Streptomyces sp. NWU339 TaxID=2185284 RepID=UPI0011B51E75|nr:hypothetical protein [Streptomyces sp. NWU339]
MVDVSAEISRLVEIEELNGPAVESVLAAAGWSGERRNPSKSWATTWQCDDARAWIQGENPVEVEFTLWFQEVEDDRPDPDAYLDDLHAVAVAKIPEVAAQLRSGVLGERLEEPEGEVTDADSYIEHRAWRVTGKELLVGVKQDDTDTPVQLVVVLREPGADDEAYDDWL